MQTRNDPVSITNYIIGMDVFTPHFPDLRSFKQMLLTGKMEQFRDAISQNNTGGRQDGNKAQTPHQNRDEDGEKDILKLVVKRALQDAGLDKPDSNNHALIVVVHQASDLAEKIGQSEADLEQLFTLNGESLCVERVISLTGRIEEAVEKAQILLDDHICGHVLLCSLFSYCIPSNPDATQLESVQISHYSHHHEYYGCGCLVLSRENDQNELYAHLTWSNVSAADIKVNHPALAKVIASAQSGYVRFPQAAFSTNLGDEIDFDDIYSNTVEAGKQIIDNSSPDFSHPVFNPSSILWLITTALSLNTRTHFADPAARQINGEQLLNGTQVQLRPWFLRPMSVKRESEILLTREGKNLSMLWLEKLESDSVHLDQPFFNFGRCLVPISFDDIGQFEQKINQLQECVEHNPSFTCCCMDHLTYYMTNNEGTCALALQATSRHELLKEMDRARSGVRTSMQSGKDWQTPSGSFFTPRPFGLDGKIAFVYPGAFGTYIGMGREVFYLLPRVHAYLQEISNDPGTIINEQTIFPRLLTEASKDQLQRELDNNPNQMISSGICFSYLFTAILRDIFKITPDAAFGYSLGEISMLFATGVWTQTDGMRTSLEVSPIFHERVSGPQNAVREFWNVPQEADGGSESPLWSNYILLASPEKVNEAIRTSERVYITHINAPRQVVIGGDPSACLRVVSSLNCMYLEAPYRHAIHCPPVQSEYEAFQRLHDWPVEHQPDFPVYSSADYTPIEWDAKRIADGIAAMLTRPIDFPRLVEQVYADGARIFIELGAGNNCSKWIEAILKGRPHAAVSINVNNIPDHISILSMLARLISHRVPMDLGALIR